MSHRQVLPCFPQVLRSSLCLDFALEHICQSVPVPLPQSSAKWHWMVLSYCVKWRIVRKRALYWLVQVLNSTSAPYKLCYLSKLKTSPCLSFHLLTFFIFSNALQSLTSTYLCLNPAESQLTEHPEKQDADGTSCRSWRMVLRRRTGQGGGMHQKADQPRTSTQSVLFM